MIGRPRVHHRVADSTNQRARELAERGAPHGTVVTAEEQSAGRGRHGRSWVAPAGAAVLVSLIVRNLDERFPLLPLAAAVAVSEAAESLAPVACRIKWPNDVWIERRKVCGILVEGRPAAGWAVLGIGLNVTTATEDFPEELRLSATSLRAASGARVLVEPATKAVLDALARWLERGAPEVLDAFRTRDALRGERVRWSEGEGIASGIDDTGALLVETDAGTTMLGAGEVHLLR